MGKSFSRTFLLYVVKLKAKEKEYCNIEITLGKIVWTILSNIKYGVILWTEI